MVYQCEQCGYVTSRAFNFNRHLKTHRANEQLSNRAIEQMSNSNEQMSNSLSNRAIEQLSNRAIEQYGNYKTVHTAEEIIEPEPDKDEAIEYDLKVIGDIASKVNKASKKALEQYKPEVKVTAKPNDNSALAVVLISLLISAVIIYILFKDKINDWLSGFNIGSGSVINPDNTLIRRE